MSKILINQYYQNLDRTLQFGKSLNEQIIYTHSVKIIYFKSNLHASLKT